MTVARALAEFLVARTAAGIPPATRASARRCLLDLVGAAAAGQATAAARAARAVAVATFAGGPARVWFTGQRRRPAGAALANSAAASALDVDDGHRAAAGHPGAAVIPAALAVAEETGAGGADLLAAIVLGYEVAVRVAAARDYATLDTVSSGRWGPFGAAAAAGWLRRLAPDRLAHALVIGGYQAPLLVPTWPTAHHLKEGIPWSVLAGLAATDLAAHGLEGPADLLDRAPYYDGSRILQGLGDTYAIDGVYLKPYACCRWIHPAIDALLALQAQHAVGPGEVTAVEVSTFGRALRLANDPDPRTLETAQYSFPFCLAVAAMDGPGSLQPLAETSLGRPELVAFARRVTLRQDATFDAVFPARAPARVVLHTGRGRLERQVDVPAGDPGQPLEPGALEAKVARLARGVWSAAAVARVVEAVGAIEDGGPARLLRELGRAVG
jgi:2-methylcitrate dehydratase PrpD